MAHKPTPIGSRAKGADAAGILFSCDLPDEDFDGLWESIILDKELQDRLHAQAVLNFTLRPRVRRDRVPLHGIILLVGPPGTGAPPSAAVGDLDGVRAGQVICRSR